MFKFGKVSMGRLLTCAPELQQVMLEAIKTSPMDFMIVCGHRNREEQARAVRMGNSKVKWPNSKHNSKPSRAVDIAPYINGKLSWKDEDCVALSKHILGVASRLGVPLRWGGDFNMDGDKTKYDAWDKPHYELVTIKTPKEKET